MNENDLYVNLSRSIGLKMELYLLFCDYWQPLAATLRNAEDEQ